MGQDSVRAVSDAWKRESAKGNSRIKKDSLIDAGRAAGMHRVIVAEKKAAASMQQGARAKGIDTARGVVQRPGH